MNVASWTLSDASDANASSPWDRDREEPESLCLTSCKLMRNLEVRIAVRLVRSVGDELAVTRLADNKVHSRFLEVWYHARGGECGGSHLIHVSTR